MVLSREGFLAVRIREIKAQLLYDSRDDGRPEMPDHVLDAWALHQAEQEWNKHRVFTQPVLVGTAMVYVQNGTEEHGAILKFNSGGSIETRVELSFAELRALVLDGRQFLADMNEWNPDDEGHFNGYPLGPDGRPAPDATGRPADQP